MEEKNLTKMYVPIFTVVGMITMLGAVIWFAAVQSTKIEIHDKDLKEIKVQIRDVPTRNEYNDLKLSIAEIKKAIEDLRSFLTKK